MEPPIPPLRRARFTKRRVDFDKPMLAAELYEGGRPVILARLERRGNRPEETVPMTLSDMRHQIDIERGYIDNPSDRPSALIGIGQPDTSPRRVDRQPADVSRQPADVSRAPLRGLGALGQDLLRPRALYIPKFQPSMTIRGLGATAVESRRGPMAMRTPALLLPATALRGLGATEGGVEIGATGFLLLALGAAGGYFAGAAMAPSKTNTLTYGIVGSVLGVFTGPIGLGVLGLVALSKK